MGLFNNLFCKGQTSGASSNNAVISWLQEVDAVYTEAFAISNANKLGKYLTRECLANIMERVRIEEKAYAGIERYKRVTWVAKGVTDEGKIYNKSVRFDDVKMSHGVVIPIGEACAEEWLVVKVNNELRIADIRRV